METDAFRFTVGDVECGAARDGDEIVPGITVVGAPGHTPGDIAVKISSRGETLLTFPTSPCIHFIWSIRIGYRCTMSCPTTRPPASIGSSPWSRPNDIPCSLTTSHLPQSWLREEEQPRLTMGTA